MNDVFKSTLLTASMFVALLSEHFTIAFMCGMFLLFVLLTSMVDEGDDEGTEKATGAGTTDGQRKSC